MRRSPSSSHSKTCLRKLSRSESTTTISANMMIISEELFCKQHPKMNEENSGVAVLRIRVKLLNDGISLSWTVSGIGVLVCSSRCLPSILIF
ncbi:hypothetical protein GCK32_013699 [Trichostrongylus colubriformis]|uniref:Uncharacterized protein n=1 Tax=Trichostrongylus colubriformis TaxID=6319 RepID=A0AAN8EW65_TRICO